MKVLDLREVCHLNNKTKITQDFKD